MATVNHDSNTWEAGGAPIPGTMNERQFEQWVVAADGVRAEWVDGEVHVMSPASFDHLSLNGWLFRLLGDFVESRGLGGVVGFDFMIRLGGGKSRRVPDIFFVAESRRTLIRPTYLDGAPDLAVEIVSQDSPARGWREKYLEYEAAGVREYWIVDRFSRNVEANRLSESGKFSRIDEIDGKINSAVLSGFYLRNDWLWATPLPTVAGILTEIGSESRGA
jgi:Uma2 family endonuclease